MSLLSDTQIVPQQQSIATIKSLIVTRAQLFRTFKIPFPKIKGLDVQGASIISPKVKEALFQSLNFLNENSELRIDRINAVKDARNTKAVYDWINAVGDNEPTQDNVTNFLHQNFQDSVGHIFPSNSEANILGDENNPLSILKRAIFVSEALFGLSENYLLIMQDVVKEYPEMKALLDSFKSCIGDIYEAKESLGSSLGLDGYAIDVIAREATETLNASANISFLRPINSYAWNPETRWSI